MHTATNPETVSVSEAARRSGLTIKYWYDLLHSGRVIATKVDGKWEVPVEAVEAVIAKREKN